MGLHRDTLPEDTTTPSEVSKMGPISDAGLGARAYHVWNANGMDERKDMLAHDALDGDLLFHSRRATRYQEHRARHSPTCCSRTLVHALPCDRPHHALA
jgi:hypothetical protein